MITPHEFPINSRRLRRAVVGVLLLAAIPAGAQSGTSEPETPLPTTAPPRAVGPAAAAAPPVVTQPIVTQSIVTQPPAAQPPAPVGPVAPPAQAQPEVPVGPAPPPTQAQPDVAVAPAAPPAQAQPLTPETPAAQAEAPLTISNPPPAPRPPIPSTVTTTPRGMPGTYVARPITLPEGAVSLAFTHYSAFIDAAESLGWMPSLAIGVTPKLEVGFEVPVRYDQGIAQWAMLDPIPHATWTWLQSLELEAAVKVRALIPATSNIGAALGVEVPFIWKAASVLRVSALPRLTVGVESPAPTHVGIPVGLTVQATPWFFTGIEAGPDVGLSKASETAVDAHFLLGLTLQTRGTAHLDLTARLFVENAGAGEGDRLSDGAGTIISVGFFPQL